MFVSCFIELIYTVNQVNSIHMKPTKKRKVNPLTAPELIDIFSINPSLGYSYFVSNCIYRNDSFTEFWGFFRSCVEDLYIKLPKESGILDRTLGLGYLGLLYRDCKRAKHESESKLISLNPDSKTLLKTLFLVIELGDDGYSYEMLSAVKAIYFRIQPKLRPDSTNYSLELFNCVKFLLELEADLNKIKEYMDLYIEAGFNLTPNSENKGYLLALNDDTDRKKNLFLLNHIKTSIKLRYQFELSDQEVSKELHFLLNDPKYKTQEGLATIIHNSSVMITQQMPGTTSMQIEDKIFEKMKSKDELERKEADLEFWGIINNQHFHFYYRLALASIYQPNDDIEIHELMIKLDDKCYMSVYEIFTAISSLTAYAKVIGTFDGVPGGDSIQSLRSDIHQHITISNKEISEDSAYKEANKYIANKLLEIEESKTPFRFLKKENIFNIFRKIEELKNKSNEELELLLELLADIKSQIPILPIFKVQDEYYFSLRSCASFNLNRLLYDYFITDRLYNNYRIADTSHRKQIGKNSQGREQSFNNSVKKCLQQITPYVETNVKYPNKKEFPDFGEIDGEIDVLAYFKEENTLLTIQVKLSNTTIKTEKYRKEWVENKIKNLAVKQVTKDVTLFSLSNQVGLQYAESALGVGFRIPSNAKLYPLILTDNFFADHQKYSYDLKGSEVLCISFFELKHSILKSQISISQKVHVSNNEKSTIPNLIDQIERNIFWDSLIDQSCNGEIIKSLYVFPSNQNVSLMI